MLARHFKEDRSKTVNRVGMKMRLWFFNRQDEPFLSGSRLTDASDQGDRGQTLNPIPLEFEISGKPIVDNHPERLPQRTTGNAPRALLLNRNLYVIHLGYE